MRLRYTPRSQREIADIHDYIAKDNPAAARRVEEAIHAQCERVAERPRAGAMTDEEDVRRMPIVRYPYTIFYRIDEGTNEVQILTVVHGKRVRDLGKVP